MHEPEAWGSPNAVEARRLVLKMIEGLKDGLVKRDNWRAGWRVAASKQKDDKKENVDTPLDLSNKPMKRKAENETTTSKKVCDDKKNEKERSVFRDITKVTENSEVIGKKKESLSVRFRCSRLSESSEEEGENIVQDITSYEEETLTATKLIEAQLESEKTKLHDTTNDMTTEHPKETTERVVDTANDMTTEEPNEITQREVDTTSAMTTEDPKETTQRETVTTNDMTTEGPKETTQRETVTTNDMTTEDPKETTEREVNTANDITKEDPKETTQKEVNMTNSMITKAPQENTKGEVTNKENKRMYAKVHEETPPSENVENQVTKDKPKETTNEPAAHINTENMTYREKAVDLLKTGAMPMVPPGRREWKEGAAFHIHLHGCDFTWPPQDWEKMSSDRRLMAWEHTAFQIEYLRQGSLSPTLSRSFLLDKYNFLALPGSGKVKREKSEKGSAKSRFYLYQVLKEVANSKEPSEAEKSQIDSLLMIRKDDELNRQLRSLEIPLRIFQ